MRNEYHRWKADPDAYLKQIVLPIHTDFNFQQSLWFLARSDKECLHQTMNDQVIKLFVLGDIPALVSIGPHESGLVLRCLNRVLSQPEKDSIRREVADWLDTETELNAFYQLAQRDSILSSLAARYRGLRMVMIPDAFEALSWAIIGQQINLAYAFTLKKRFVEQFGAWLDFDGKRYFTYPTAEVIAQQTTRSLELSLPQRKAAYILHAARAMADGRITKDGLKQLGFTEARRQLLTLKGVGDWTAHYVLMKSLRYPQAFPLEDVGLHNAIKKVLNLSRKPSLLEVAQHAQRWEGWQAYAAFYLWRSLVPD
jgi:DNA-3-methyladenine glycosylase II